jgi:hypothetical protein
LSERDQKQSKKLKTVIKMLKKDLEKKYEELSEEEKKLNSNEI